MVTIAVPTDGDDILGSWAADVAEAINASHYDAAFLPFAYPIGCPADVVSGATNALAAVSGGLAGSALVPFWLPGPLLIQSVTIRNGDTASARSCEFRLYRDNGQSALDFVTGTDGTLSFTPSAASDRTGNVSTPGTLITPGCVWLAIRNTSASQTFGLRRLATTELSGNVASIINTASLAALGSTLDTAIMTGSPSLALARLNGRVFGGSAAF